MTPGAIVSAHNVLSTVPVSERYLSACYMPTANVRSQDVSFRVIVAGQVVYNGPGSPAVPTCIRLQYPMDMPNGTEVRVQVLVSGSMLAEDVYRHEEISPAKKTLQNVEQATSQLDPKTTFFFVVLVAALIWYFFFREDEEEVVRRRRSALPQIPMVVLGQQGLKVQR